MLPDCSRDPTQDRMQNVLFLLYHHLSHDSNAHLLPALLEVAAAMGPHASRMLRVLSRQLFAAHMYRTGKLIARGAYATVSLQARWKFFVVTDSSNEWSVTNWMT